MKRRVTRETEMLRKARLEMGYTQQEVATLIGVHIKAYQRLEYGERDLWQLHRVPPGHRVRPADSAAR